MDIDYSYHYKKWHNDSPEHFEASAPYYHRILGPYLPADKQAAVLDIGCGMGLALYALEQLGYRNVSGIDSDAGQVAVGHAKGLQVTQCADSIVFLRSHPARFQLVLAFDLLEHILPAHQVEFAAAIACALAPGGRLVGTTPNANSALASRCRYLDWTHQTAFTEHSLDFLLHNAGFRDIRIAEIEYSSRPRLWWLPIRSGRRWWLFRFFRAWRRLEMLAELGMEQGRRVPLSLNLFFAASKP